MKTNTSPDIIKCPPSSVGHEKMNPCQLSLEYSAVKLWNTRWRMDIKQSQSSASPQGNYCHLAIITRNFKKAEIITKH